MSEMRLTGGDYWDSGYEAVTGSAPLDIRDYRHLGERRIVERIERLGLDGRRVLEVGAGNSAILTYLARAHPTGAFYGLDYSHRGVRLLVERARAEKVVVTALTQDLFEPDPTLLGGFDVVFSLGVVEHFRDLAEVVAAKRRLLAPGGVMFTLIPNMRGVLGFLTRRWAPQVYDLHVPHDLPSLVEGHRAAGLTAVESGYLCSTNFGVLSSCFPKPDQPGWRSYKWLSRFSKLLWLMESRTGDLPHTPQLSPYLFVSSRLAA